MLSTLTVGDGVLEALADTFTGTVVGLFRGGFYVTGPQGAVFAVLGSQHWAGPLHLLVPSLLALPERDDAVTFADGVLAAGGIRLRVDASRRWAADTAANVLSHSCGALAEHRHH